MRAWLAIAMLGCGAAAPVPDRRLDALGWLVDRWSCNDVDYPQRVEWTRESGHGMGPSYAFWTVLTVDPDGGWVEARAHGPRDLQRWQLVGVRGTSATFTDQDRRVVWLWRGGDILRVTYGGEWYRYGRTDAFVRALYGCDILEQETREVPFDDPSER